jgi:hypothetical protein
MKAKGYLSMACDTLPWPLASALISWAIPVLISEIDSALFAVLEIIFH